MRKSDLNGNGCWNCKATCSLAGKDEYPCTAFTNEAPQVYYSTGTSNIKSKANYSNESKIERRV